MKRPIIKNSWNQEGSIIYIDQRKNIINFIKLVNREIFIMLLYKLTHDE